MGSGSVPSQLGQVLARFGVQEAAADHAVQTNPARADSQGEFSDSQGIGVYHHICGARAGRQGSHAAVAEPTWRPLLRVGVCESRPSNAALPGGRRSNCADTRSLIATTRMPCWWAKAISARIGRTVACRLGAPCGLNRFPSRSRIPASPSRRVCARVITDHIVAAADARQTRYRQASSGQTLLLNGQPLGHRDVAAFL